MSSEAVGGIDTGKEGGLPRAALRYAVDTEGGVDREGESGVALESRLLECRDGSEQLPKVRKLRAQKRIDVLVGLTDADAVQEEDEEWRATRPAGGRR